MLGTALTSCLLFFTVYGAIIPDPDQPLKRIARCDVCGQAQFRIPHPPPPPPPPPFFHTHQWSGLARNGYDQEVFSGAAAAANGGAQASGQAFSLASSSVNSGGANQGASYKNTQYHHSGSGHSAGAGYGNNEKQSLGSADQGQQVQSSGFGSEASSQAQSGHGKQWESNKDRSNYLSHVYNSGSYQETNQNAGHRASGQIGNGGNNQQQTQSLAFADQEGSQKTQSKAFRSAASSQAQSGAGNSWDQTKEGTNHVGKGSSSFGRGDLNEDQKYSYDAHTQVQAQGSHGGYSNAGQQHQITLSNSAHGNHEVQSSHNHAVDAGFAGNNQQVQKENYESGKWEKSGSSGHYGESQSSSSSKIDSGVQDEGQATLHGALDLASQSLQTSQQLQQSAAQPGCNTCGKSNYALSNAKSTSGNAVAVSIGG